MIDMHVYLPEKYRFPNSDAHLLAIRSLPFFLCRPIRVPAIHSIVNAMFIIGCPYWFLLSFAYQTWPCPPSVVLFDSSWMSLTNHSSSGLSWEIVLSLIVCIVPTLIKRFFIINLILDCQSVMNFPIVETIFFKYMLSSVYLETIQSSRHASHSLQ